MVPKIQVPLVRLAQLDDREEIFGMCQRLHAENGLFTFDADRVRNVIERYYQRQNVILGVIGVPGKLEACTCIELCQFYYTGDWHLEELWNYVDEPYRRSRNAEALITFGKSCADQMSTQERRMPLVTGIVTNKHMAGKVRLYRKLLGYPAGAYFVYNAPPHWKTEPMEDHTALRNRLREHARLCATNKITQRSEIAQLSSLLREAAEAFDRADNLWGTKAKPNNGASAA